MRRWLLVLVALVGCLFAASTSVSAHELEADGTIGAVLHVDPDDNPTSGIPVTYLLAFKDTTHRFTLPGCDCMLRISEDDRLLFTHALVIKYPLDSENVFTFPRPGVYVLTVSGAPKQAGAFQPFTLHYTLRVTGGMATQTQPFPLLLWVGAGMLIGIILLAAYKAEHNSD